MRSKNIDSVNFIIYNVDYGFLDGYYVNLKGAVLALREIRQKFPNHYFSLNCIVDQDFPKIEDSNLIRNNYDIFKSNEFDITSRDKCPVIPINCEESYN